MIAIIPTVSNNAVIPKTGAVSPVCGESVPSGWFGLDGFGVSDGVSDGLDGVGCSVSVTATLL